MRSRSVYVPVGCRTNCRPGDRPQVPDKGDIPRTGAVSTPGKGRQPTAGPVEQQLRRGDFLLCRLQPGYYQRVEVRGKIHRANPPPCV